MESVLRTVLVFGYLMVVVRVSGKRTLSETTPFDFLLLLIVSEATQNAMIGSDRSVTNALIVITTLFVLNIGLSLLRRQFRVMDRWLVDVPLVLVEHGKPIPERLWKSRLDESDILAAARLSQGLERMDQIKYAVLERTGGISIIPQPGTR